MKKIIYAVALVLSFGLLASCNQVYATKNAESTTYSYVVSATGTCTYTSKSYNSDRSEVTGTTKEVWTLQNDANSSSVITYTEDSNSNYVLYNLPNIKTVSYEEVTENKATKTKTEIKTVNGKVTSVTTVNGVANDAIIYDSVEDFAKENDKVAKWVGDVYAYGDSYYMQGYNGDTEVNFEEDGDVITVSGSVVPDWNKDGLYEFSFTFTKEF